MGFEQQGIIIKLMLHIKSQAQDGEVHFLKNTSLISICCHCASEMPQSNFRSSREEKSAMIASNISQVGVWMCFRIDSLLF